MSTPIRRDAGRAQSVPFAEILFIVSILFLVGAGIVALTLPSQMPVVYGLLGVGALLLSIVCFTNPGFVAGLFTDRRSRLLLNDLVLILAIIGIAVCLSFIGFRRHARWDLTKNQLFSLTDQTRKVLRDLKREVQVTAFFSRNAHVRTMVEDFLTEYKRETDQVKIKMIDPFQDPMIAQAMKISGDQVIVVVCGNNRREIFPQEIFTAPPMGSNEPPKFHGEHALTSALINVTRDSRRRICFTSGHEEPSINAFGEAGFGVYQKLLDKDNFEVAETNLLKEGGIPASAAVLVVAAPKKPFNEAEVKMIREWLATGKGRLLVAVNPENDLAGLGGMLAETLGVTANAEMIINQNKQLMVINPGIVIPDMVHHPVVRDLIEKKLGAFMVLCRGLTIDNRPDWKSTVFLKTAPDTYAKRNLSEVFTTGRADFNAAQDVRGPFNLAVALEGQNAASGSRAIVVGDANFLGAQYIQELANPDLAVNMVSWLAGQEDTIAIRPRVFDIPRITLTREDTTSIFTRTVVFPPLLICILGGLVYFYRRMV